MNKNYWKKSLISVIQFFTYCQIDEKLLKLVYDDSLKILSNSTIFIY